MDADSRLADAIWWFTGFEAATARLGCPMDRPEDPSRGLADALRSVRDRLDRLSRGLDRVIGVDHRQLAIAVTEGEFETILDGLQRNTKVDQANGLALAREILGEFQREVADANEVEAPF